MGNLTLPMHDQAATLRGPSTRRKYLWQQIADIMADGDWWSLERLRSHTGAAEASISARIRDLRLERYGGYRVECVWDQVDGIHKYRLGESDEGSL